MNSKHIKFWNLPRHTSLNKVYGLNSVFAEIYSILLVILCSAYCLRICPRAMPVVWTMFKNLLPKMTTRGADI